MNIILLGAPGSGKGSQAELLVSDFGLVQISTGDLLRNAIASGTEDGKTAYEFVQKGGLVPDELVFSILKKRMEEPDAASGVIFDGYPRTVRQASDLDVHLNSVSQKIDFVFTIVSDFDVVVKRLLARRLCEKCGKGYNLVSCPPPESGQCDVCGGNIVQRSDDNESVIRKRLEVYSEATRPLIEYYRGRGQLEEVDGDRTVSEVYSEIKAIIDRKLT